MMSPAQQQPEPEVVEIGVADVVGAEHQHAFSWGWTVGSVTPGLREGDLRLSSARRAETAMGLGRFGRERSAARLRG